MNLHHIMLTSALVLELAQLRVNSVGSGASMLPQSIQNSAPIHGAVPSHGPAMVNYRALLAGDTDCDYEV